MSERHDLIQAIRQVLYFCRPHVRIRFFDKSRIESQLPKPRDRREHTHPIRIHVAQQIENPRALARQVLVVNMAVLLTQIDAHDVDDLIGQIRSDLLLRATQNERRNIGRQTPEHR